MRLTTHLRRSVLALTAAAALALTGCASNPDAAEPGSAAPAPSSSASEASGTCSYPASSRPASKDVDAPAADPTETAEVPVTVATGVGELKMTLDAAKTPCTVNNFLSLAEQGYFDGTTCHRLTTDGIFVLQCGDPSATGTGGPGYSFADELDGSETYEAGTLAMANAGPDTNGSQFFIVYADSQLPPNYAVFGHLDEASTAVVADVAAAGTDNGGSDGAPKTPVMIESVTKG
ncbi:peptidylprolyl isomerase [Microbacterium sp. NPDC089987]|uniref:peptidylprolyl isomerase n=1 Tax=Microbacterium sp. NPDC089987 TaxID=3364202 RepID=UPI0037F7A8BA